MKRIINTENRISLIAIFILIVVICLRFQFPPTNVLSWDVFGYYMYLPAKSIYHDLGLTNKDWLNKLINHYHTNGTLYQAYIGLSRQWMMKYSLGMAVLYTPLFFVYHWLAGPSEYFIDYQDTLPVLVLTFEDKGSSFKYFDGNLVCNDNERGNGKKDALIT
jgi:hypothetical protein